ncbi:bifunctional protein ThiO/ThiG [Arthrobacter sp. Hiyo4]|nr:bifunctional protein ThiO/ThiG [Arthrobacter sp. Hiyo4]
MVIGATQREDALAGTGDAAVSAGGVYQLLRDAQVLVPAVSELELLECTARARPATPDNAPLLGRVPVSAPRTGNTANIAGLMVATGFFRHGVLLAPAAAAICRDLLEGRTDPRWEALSPARFSGKHHVAGVHSPDNDIRTKDLDPQKESA